MMAGKHHQRKLQSVKTILGTSRSRMQQARLENMSMERTIKKISEGEMQDKTPRGRPRLRWTDNIK